MIKKSVLIIGIIIYFGVIFTTSSPIQHNNVFDNNSSFPLKNNIQFIYAEGDDGGGDNKEETRKTMAMTMTRKTMAMTMTRKTMEMTMTRKTMEMIMTRKTMEMTMTRRRQWR